MRSWIYLMLIFRISGIAASEIDIDEECKKILPIISNLKPAMITELYEFKKQHKYWYEKSEYENILYTLKPKNIISYNFSWTTLNKNTYDEDFSDGNIICEIPSSWQLIISSPLNIVYPKVTHNHSEELSLYSVKTVAGIYLAKSKISSIFADFVRIIWHLKQDAINNPNIANEIISNKKFIDNNITVTEDVFDKTDQVQTIAVHLSNQSEIKEGNHLWLIADADTQKGIYEASYRTSVSERNTLFPWFDPNNLEFTSITPFDAYEATIVGPLGILSIFNKKTQFLVEPLALRDQIQMVHDTIAPPAYNFLNEAKPLFVHLVLSQPHDYKFLTFEILRDGTFKEIARVSLNDPSEIGLPSAKKLGFLPSSNDGI